jgi:hypothetical protein
MKVELVNEGASECPLVRFYGGDPAEFRRLRHLTSSLASHQESCEDVSATDGFTLLGIRAVRLTNTADEGMVEDGSGSLKWSLSPTAWLGVAELIDPLCSPDAVGTFQWLDEAGRGFSSGLAVLASVSEHGHW